ncbi:condensation domain-containing protein [Rudaeicoccus suwonensis]|uniref:Condensation domain-containing protein n=1 Tax=Rudaeicoccus suwonensis TaxID=657409 RepID=A0A561DX69_9MICO|nr:condensation domain-containing protein [Rudaeicoccus suwonensis]TWE07953.1 condensation domain-containing protein [Rudaeicoccus suwonensis]
MEYTELADYSVFAGDVTLWSASADTALAAVDQRPVSPQHETHVTARNDGDPDWIGTVFEIRLPFDADVLRATLEAWHSRHESFRTTVRITPNGLQRLTFRAEDVTVTGRPAGSHQTVERVYDVVSRFFDRTISPSTWPHLVAATVVPDDQEDGPRFLLAFAADHSVLDAYSQVIAISELDQLYAAILHDIPPSLDPPAASYIDFSAEECGMAALAIQGNDTTERWRSFLSVDERCFPGFPLPTADHNGSCTLPQRSASRQIVAPEVADTLHAVARSCGFGMQPAILVALARAIAATTDGAPLRMVMPMHTRSERYQTSMGWFVGISPLTLDLTGAADLKQELQRAEDASAYIRTDAQIPFATIAQLLDIRSCPRFVVSYVDIRHLPGAAQFDAQRARALRSIRYSDDEVYLWIVRARGGINVSARFPNNMAAADSFERFLAAFTEAVHQLAGVPVPEAAQVRVPAV